MLTLHALRNASIPIVTLLGLQFAQLLGGAVVTETIFAWPGLGRLVVEAIFNRDFPVVQGVVLVVSLLFVVVSLLIDVAYALLDPRVRTHLAERSGLLAGGARPRRPSWSPPCSRIASRPTAPTSRTSRSV